MSDVEVFEILYRDWNLKPIFTPQWASVDMNLGGGGGSTPNLATIPTLNKDKQNEHLWHVGLRWLIRVR